jgi:hypothetical protein
MDEWMVQMNGWMDGWYVNRKLFSCCILVPKVTMVVSFVLSFHNLFFPSDSVLSELQLSYQV